ncbi:MAG: T9SS type A sorting domain-containing protein [Ekhidna sp.]
MKKTLLSFFLVLFHLSILSQIVDPSFRPILEGLPEITVLKNFDNDKLLVAGTFTSVQDIPMEGAVLLNTDGTIDSNFSNEVISTGYLLDAVYDSESNKYYVSGNFDNFNAVIRLNSDGTLDDTFNLATNFNSVSHLGLQSDGKLIVVSSSSDLGIARLNIDGSLDESFNNSTGFNEANSLSSDLKIQSDDKILFGGDFTSFNDESIANLIRLNADGSIDDLFDFAGSLTASSGNPYINSVLPLSNGDIVLAGSFDAIYGTAAKSLGRVNSDGSLETSFVLPGPGANLFDRSVRAILDQDEKILVSGINSGIDDYSLLRLTNDGVLDQSFNTGTIELNNSLGYLLDPFMAISESGEIYYSTFYTHYDGHFSQGLSKLDVSGNVMTTYNADIGGKASVNVSKIMDDGSVFIGGNFTSVNNLSMSFFAKLLADGTVDTDFMENVGEGPDLTVATIENDNNGNILVGGGFTNFNNENTGLLVRLSNEGIRDVGFNPRVFPRFVGPGVHDLLITDSNHIFVGGLYLSVDNQALHGLTKINDDGSLDNTFDLGLSNESDVSNIQLLSDGSLFYSGNIGFREGVILGKVDLMGNADADFKTTYDFSDISIGATAIVPDTEGILVSTFSDNNYKLIQFESDGTFKDDISVGVTGSSGISSILPLDSENILIGGQFNRVNGVESPGFAKVSLTGSIDQDFNYGFVEIGNFSGPSVSSINDLGDSKYLISGNFSKIDGEDVTSLAIINTAVPKAPTSLTAIFSFANGVSLSWDDNSNIETGYELYRKASDGEFELLSSLNDNQNTYEDIDVLQATSYTYRVKAINGDLASSYSEEVELETDMLIAPTGLNIEFGFTTGITLSWINNSDSEESITVLRALDGEDFQVLVELDALQQAYEDITVNLNTTYTYALKIETGLFEVSSETLVYTTPESAMLPVPQLNLDESGETANLNWDYDVPEILGFAVYSSEANSSEFELLAETSENEYSLPNLQQGVQYTFKIQALNAFESSEFSNEVTFLILGVDDSESEYFKLYPNPVKSKFQIVSRFSEGDYEIMDINGRRLKQGSIQQSTDVSDLSSGMYLAKIYVNNKVIIKKFVISRE